MSPNQQAEKLSLIGGGRGEPLLRQAFDLAADGIAVLDATGPLARIVLANATFGRRLGVAAAMLAGDALQSWVAPASAANLQSAVAAAVATGGGGDARAEVALVAADGTQWWALAVLRRLDEPEGTRLLATFTDLSERKALEETTATLPLMMAGLDRQLRVVWLNEALRREIGRPNAEIIGKDWLAIFPCFASRRPVYERVLAGESLDFDRVDITRPQGDSLSLATSLRPIRRLDGKIDGLMVMARDVGALLRAEAERRQAEHRLSVLVEKCQDVITVLSRDGIIEYQSPACQRLTGFAAEELLGRNVFEFAHPDDLPQLRQRFAAHLADQNRLMPDPAEARFRHKGGGWVWIELVATNAFADPAIRGLVMVARGIDRRKAVEAEIAANRALLEFSLDAARIGAWDYDVLSGVHRFDARCRTLIGGPAEHSSVPLDELARMTHPDDLARSRAELLRHIKGETPWYEIEYRARVDSGPWHWVYARGRVSARSGDGRATRLSGVMMGINERRRAEIELRESESRLETALWGGDVGFWSWSTEGGSFVSDNWLALTGYTRAEWAARGSTWESLMHADDRARVCARIERFMAGQEESLDSECRIQTKCGDWIWMHMRARAPERAADGRALRVFGTSVDVTAQKKMREFLEETQAAASVGGWELNLRNQALTWTAETYALFEASPAEFTPSLANAFDLYDPSCHAQMQAAMGGAIERGEPFDIEVRAHTLKGRQMWLRLVGKAERADGQTVRLYGAKQDITALREAESARRAALAEQRAVTENAPDWLILVDTELRVKYANRPLRGVPVAEVIGRNGLDLLDPSVRGLLDAACQSALVEQKRSFAETYEQMPWGEWCHLEYSAAPIIQDGRAVGLSVRVSDVTGRKLAQQRLRTQARVLETMREGVVLFGADGTIRVANAAADRLFGVAPGSLPGAACTRLGLAPEVLGRVARAPAGDETTPAPLLREWLARRDDGTEFLVEGVFSSGEVDGEPTVIGVVQDVTDRRQLERAIIEASSFEQQRIASDLHDGLGQELTGIALLLRTALGQLAADPAGGLELVREASDLVDGAVQSARALAHGLAPAALELGGLPGALSDLAQRVRRTYGIRAQFRKNIEVPLRLDTAQASHLYRIAQECVNNAVRHGKATFITLRLVADGQSMKLEIVDNGSGMPAPERRSASGMGLRIMEYRARMLGGELGIRTPRRGGTAICCCVPLKPPRD